MNEGLSWFGSLPNNWHVVRFGTCFRERRTSVSDTDFAPLSVTMQGIVPQMEHVAKSSDGDNRKLVRKGDFVINSRSDRKGSSGVSDYDGSVSLISIVLEPLNFKPSYIHYLLRSQLFIEEFYRNGHGIVADLWTTRFADIKSAPICVPPLPTQTRIANFLDEKTALIDKAIAQKQRLIALLEERRQILIHQAVTRGLDPNVELRDSGVDWIGKVPKHWEVVKAKWSFTKFEQGWSPQCDNIVAEAGEWGVVKVGCVNGVSFNPFQNKKLPNYLNPNLEYEISEGDILISRANSLEWVGSASIAKDLYTRLILCDKIYRIKLSGKYLNSSFYVTQLRSKHVRSYIESRASGASSSMQNISQNVIRDMEISRPPKDEQVEIMDRISSLNSDSSILVSKTVAQIDKLKEYKSTLINSAVTGQIEV